MYIIKTFNHYRKQFLSIIVFFIFGATIIVGLIESVDLNNKVILQEKIDNLHNSYAIELRLDGESNELILDDINSQLLAPLKNDNDYVKNSYMTFTQRIQNTSIENINDIKIHLGSFSVSAFENKFFNSSISINKNNYANLAKNEILVCEQKFLEFNLTIGKNITIEKSIINYEGEEINYSLPNQTVVGTFSISNYFIFNEYFHSDYGFNSEDSNFEILCSEENVLFKILSLTLEPTIYLAINFDFQIDIGGTINIDKIADKMHIFEINIKNNPLIRNNNAIISTYIIDEISQVKEITFTTNIICLGISIPLIFLALFQINSAISLLYNERRQELALLKIRQINSSRIKLKLIIESYIIGSVGGLAGVFIGKTSANFIFNYVMYNTIKVGWLIGIFSSINMTEILISIILCPIYCILIGIHYYNEIIGEDLIYALRKNDQKNLNAQNPIKKRKKSIIYFIIILLLYISSLIFTESNTFDSDPTSGLSGFLSMLNFVVWFFIPIIPILLILGITRIIYKSYSKFNNSIANYIIKIQHTKTFGYLYRNYAKSNSNNQVKLLLVLLFLFNFTIQISSITTTQENFVNLYQYQKLGSDIRFDILNPNRISEEGLQNYIFEIQNEEILNIDSVVSTLTIERLNIPNFSESNIEFNICLLGLGFDLPIKMEYIKSEYKSENDLIYALKTIPNSTLVPNHIFDEFKLEIGETFKLITPYTNGTLTNFKEYEMIIIGSYDAFPGISPNLYSSEMISSTFISFENHFYFQQLDVFRYSLHFLFNSNLEDRDLGELVDKLELFNNVNYPEMQYQFINNEIEIEINQIETILLILKIIKFYLIIFLLISIYLIFSQFLNQNEVLDSIYLIRKVTRKQLISLSNFQFLINIILCNIVGFFTASLSSFSMNNYLWDRVYIMTSSSIKVFQFDFETIFFELMLINIFFLSYLFFYSKYYYNKYNLSKVKMKQNLAN